MEGGALASQLWSQLQVSPSDPLDQSLLKSMKEGMVNTRSASTWTDSYLGIISRYRAFCAAKVPPRVPVPAAPLTVCLFLQLVASEAKSYAVVKSASGAIFALHEMALVPAAEAPTKHPLAKGVRQSAKRRLGLKLQNQKEPLTLEVLQTGILLYVPDFQACSLLALSVASMVANMWAGFLRYKDMKYVWVELVKFYPTHMEALLIERKNDQFREGDVVYISRGLDRRTCPVALNEALISRARLSGLVNLYQGWDGRVARFRPQNTQLNGRHIEYPQCRREVHKFLQRTTGMSEAEVQKKWCTQSLRSSGATVAAQKVDFRLFQKHGAWHTASSAHRYILDSTETRLSVTRAMGY
ncbi:hypothetical protein CYMTET_56568 [Cymbomonas tetramitiformis]|uniref:Uncharacterized protein n=1 Tax=Cymbomonas tetramitiformis TaxID=36881 RepID=A0AAE0BB16_9CHLO|nr:hypothetical protein CYMTET_56568 [Cymbomonas tetramitiformis]